jgi:spermidine/putrescine transport system substrate-binding protein
MRRMKYSREKRRELDRLVEELARGRLSRREFLKRGAALGFSLAFLGGITSLFQARAYTLPPPEDLLEAVRREGSRLNVYNWSDYIDEGRVEEFESLFGVKVIYDTYESNDEMKAKIQAGGSGYDVVYPTNDTLEGMIYLGLLQELNHDWIPNMVYLLPQFVNPPYDPGNKYSVAYQWGTTGYCYNSAQVSEGDPRIGSWKLLFEGAEYAGKMAMLNEVVEVVGAALKYLGYSFNTGQPWQEGDEQKLLEARDVLLRQKPWLKAYIDGGEMKKPLIAEEIWIGQEWSGDALMAWDENENLIYIIPQEGGSIWVDSMAIPKDAPHPAAAHLWINYMQEPEVQAAISNYVWYAPTNGEARQYLDERIRDHPAVFPPEGALAKCEFIKPYTGEALEIREQIWEELKA